MVKVKGIKNYMIQGMAVGKERKWENSERGEKV
jgi:hypothetical protein